MVGDESKGGPRWAQLTGDIVSPVIETEQIEGLKEVLLCVYELGKTRMAFHQGDALGWDPEIGPYRSVSANR
jgi:hypothetical protein